MSETSHGEALASVTASSYRREVLERLEKGPATPSDLADETGIDIAHVSRALTELRELDCAELTVPEDTTRGRVYAATEKGREVISKVPTGSSSGLNVSKAPAIQCTTCGEYSGKESSEVEAGDEWECANCGVTLIAEGELGGD